MADQLLFVPAGVQNFRPGVDWIFGLYNLHATEAARKSPGLSRCLCLPLLSPQKLQNARLHNELRCDAIAEMKLLLRQPGVADDGVVQLLKEAPKLLVHALAVAPLLPDAAGQRMPMRHVRDEHVRQHVELKAQVPQVRVPLHLILAVAREALVEVGQIGTHHVDEVRLVLHRAQARHLAQLIGSLQEPLFIPRGGVRGGVGALLLHHAGVHLPAAVLLVAGQQRSELLNALRKVVHTHSADLEGGHHERGLGLRKQLGKGPHVVQTLLVRAGVGHEIHVHQQHVARGHHLDAGVAQRVHLQVVEGAAHIGGNSLHLQARLETLQAQLPPGLRASQLLRRVHHRHHGAAPAANEQLQHWHAVQAGHRH
eukprot:scaffold2473_cov247-Pinguiococcus_pyrenoidosus.AAC.13